MNRTVAVISVAALFLSGLSIGALAMHLYHEGRSVEGVPPVGGPPHRGFLLSLERQLDLTPEQRDQLRAIHEEVRREFENFRRDLRPRLERQMDETRDRILAILTPEQQERFKRIESRHRGHMGRFFLGEGRPGGRGRRHGPPSDPPPDIPPDPPPDPE